jgi:hypothetical protein
LLEQLSGADRLAGVPAERRGGLHDLLLRPAVGQGQKLGKLRVRFLLIPECR